MISRVHAEYSLGMSTLAKSGDILKILVENRGRNNVGSGSHDNAFAYSEMSKVSYFDEVHIIRVFIQTLHLMRLHS